MWQIIILTIFPHIFGAAIQPMASLDDPLWGRRIAEALLPEEDLRNENTELYNHPLPFDNVDTTDQRYIDAVLRPAGNEEKRALAMFARWNSLSSVGKNRPPIRSNLFDADSISAQTRARIPGQPLRWG